MTTSPSYSVTIYVSLYETNAQHAMDAGLFKRRLQEHIAQSCRGTPAGCVSVTPTTFVHCDGMEDGFAIGFINYPRYPTTPDAIREAALNLADWLMHECRQRRVSVEFPDATAMLSYPNSTLEDATAKASEVTRGVSGSPKEGL